MLPTTTPLGFLNFLVMQWFFVRLVQWWPDVPEDAPRGRWWSKHAPRGVRVRFRFRAAWPITGWWGTRIHWISVQHVLNALNFVVLQWLCVRLERMTMPGVWHMEVLRGVRGGQLVTTDDVDTNSAKPAHRWSLFRWIWPLTGWWSPLVWIARPEVRASAPSQSVAWAQLEGRLHRDSSIGTWTTGAKRGDVAQLEIKP
jgi:hypothetical protein